MKFRALALVAAVLLAFGASGAVAAPTTGPTAASQPSPDAAQHDDHTVDVVDPDDELTEQDVEDAWQIAWNDDERSDDVRDRLDDTESVSAEVWAPVSDDDHVSVWIAENETAHASVIADVDLDAETIVGIDEPDVRTADEFEPIDLDESSLEIDEDSEGEYGDGDESSEVEFEIGDGGERDVDDDPIRLTTDDLEIIDVVEAAFTLVGGGESAA